MMKITRILFIGIAWIAFSCGSGGSGSTSADAEEGAGNKGIGPIKKLALPATIDQQLAQKGKEVYDLKCTACHKTHERFIGPAPKGVLDRRTPEWIMNMIMNPEQMVREDPDAKALLIEYNMAPMANQGISEDDARAILEYFRTL